MGQASQAAKERNQTASTEQRRNKTMQCASHKCHAGYHADDPRDKPRLDKTTTLAKLALNSAVI